jgi:tetratricopeptide (TPR) repeat protein
LAVPELSDESKNDRKNKKSGKRRTPSEQLRVRHGKLSDRTVCDLLFYAYTTGMDGILTCTRNTLIKALRFKSGKLLEAKSNDPYDSSQWILNEMGKLQEGFQSKSTPPPLQQGQTLKLISDQIRSGLMQPNEIDEFMHRRVRRILHDLMSWTDGDYMLELSKVPRSEPALKVHRSIPEMILRELKTAPDPVGLKNILEAPSMLVEPSTSVQYETEIKLTAIEQRLLKSISRQTTVKKVASSEGIGLESTARILLGLHALSFIRIKFSSVTEQPKPVSKPRLPDIPADTKPDPSEADTAEYLSEKDFLDLQTTSVTTKGGNAESEAHSRKYLLEQLDIALSWDPYKILDLDIHCTDKEITQAYEKKKEHVHSLSTFISDESKGLLTSLLSLIEETQTILSNATLRRQFDMIRKIVDVRKKMASATQEHRKGMQAFRSKRIPLAIVHLKFAAYLEPSNADYQYRLIYLMAQNRRLWSLARHLQQRCLEKFGTNPHILALSGLLYHRTGNTVKARLEYNKALKIDPELDLAKHGLEILDRNTGKL